MKHLKPFTDLGNVERLVDLYKDDICYCRETKRWYCWSGKRWKIADAGEIFRKVQEMVKKIPGEEKLAKGDAELCKQIQAHAKRSQSHGRIVAVVKLAQTAAEFQVDVDSLDANPMLLTCENGTIDLETGRLLPHKREHLITQIAPVPYDKKAQCPNWQAFLNKVMGEMGTLVAYLQKVVGYSLTGLTTLQCLFILAGLGANGKSTFLETFRKLLGDHARHTPSCTLLVNNLAIRNDLARLRGARVVTAVEIGLGKKLDEALVKQLTGGDPITSRYLFQEYFEHRPTFKLFMAVNHLPEIRGMDHGIWRRIHLIPFNVIIKEEEMDRDLASKLEAELPGILAWAVQGCLEWQKSGLEMPSASLSALGEYREESDKIGDFIGDCCIQRADLKISIKALFASYKAWVEDNDSDPLTKKTFGQLLKQKGFKQGKSGGVRFWKGLHLISDAGEAIEELSPAAPTEAPLQTH